MSSPMPGNESTTQGLRVARAAARCGWKLSLPKRRGKSLAGRRNMALVPRPSEAGTITEPLFGRGGDDLFAVLRAWMSGMSAGTTMVVSIPRDSQISWPFRWRRFRRD